MCPAYSVESTGFLQRVFAVGCSNEFIATPELCSGSSQMSGSIYGFPLFGAADIDAMAILPMSSRDTDNSLHFVFIKRLRQHVPCSEIEGFCP